MSGNFFDRIGAEIGREGNTIKGWMPNWMPEWLKTDVSAGLNPGKPLVGGEIGSVYAQNKNAGDTNKGAWEETGRSGLRALAAFFGGSAIGGAMGGSGGTTGAFANMFGTAGGGATAAPEAVPQSTPWLNYAKQGYDYAKTGYNYYNKGKSIYDMFQGGGQGGGLGGIGGGQGQQQQGALAQMPLFNAEQYALTQPQNQQGGGRGPLSYMWDAPPDSDAVTQQITGNYGAR